MGYQVIREGMDWEVHGGKSTPTLCCGSALGLG